MTPGIFRRGRTAALLGWVIGPLAIIAIVYFPCRAHSLRVNRMLDQRRAVLEQMPEMSRQARRARDTLQKFPSPGRSGGDVSTEFTVLLNHAARENGFAVRSTVIEKGDRAATLGMSSFRIVLGGDGTLASLVRLFHALENSEYIFVVETARIGATELAPGGRYSAEIVLSCHALSL
jgi:hypothetical protein